MYYQLSSIIDLAYYNLVYTVGWQISYSALKKCPVQLCSIVTCAQCLYYVYTVPYLNGR